MPDRYKCFEELAAAHKLGVDYHIRIEDRGSPVVVLAPHGGWIEPHTSQIAETLAGVHFSFYAFETLKNGPHGDFHITSSRFDEPEALSIVLKSKVAIAIHGREDNGDEGIWLGGRAIKLREEIRAALCDSGFVAEVNEALPGVEKANICNRTSSGEGIQIELPRVLRRKLAKDPERLDAFCTAIRTAVEHMMVV